MANSHEKTCNREHRLSIRLIIANTHAGNVLAVAHNFLSLGIKMNFDVLRIVHPVHHRFGSRSEQGGIIKDGAKMVNAVANSVVPKFTVIIGNSYGAGNYAMCGKAYDPRLIVAWPTARIAVMGGAQAAKTLLQIRESALKAKGEQITKEKEEDLLKEITDQYERQTTPYYAAARLWVDAIIDPLDTRKVISAGIEAANQAPVKKAFNVGIIQT